MKKFIYMASAAALLASCSDDIRMDVTAPGQQVEVTFSAALPAEMMSRAVSDGLTANHLQWAAYKKDAATETYALASAAGEKYNAFNDRKATAEMALVTGETYTIVFWADSKADANTSGYYTFNSADGTISIDYNSPLANDEKRDAFFAVEKDYKVIGTATKEITLTRPFAQINFGTTEDDYNAAKASGLNIKTTGVTVEYSSTIYDTLNLITGKVSNTSNSTDKTITFGLSTPPTEKLTVGTDTYVYVGYTYVLTDASDQAELLNDVVLTPEATTQCIRSYTNVPIMRNYRTNIIGNLFTSNVDFKVVIDPGYTEPDTNKEYVTYKGVNYEVDRTPWSGTSSAAPYAVTIDNTNYLLIGSAAQLAGLSEMVNNYNSSRASSLGNYNKENVVLLIDIDLNNKEWTPIGHTKTGKDNDYGFHGNFDGQGHTISNLTITKKNEYGFVGLFGNTGSKTIENLVINGVNIDVAIEGPGEVIGTGALVGHVIPGGTVKNITVKNATIKTNRLAGAVVGQGYVNILDCTVDNADITVVPNLKSSNGYDNGDKIGGLCGQITEETFNISGNKLTNITLTGYRDMGGILGHLNNTTSTFKNNSITNAIIQVQGQDNYDGHSAGENVGKIIGRNNPGSIDSSNTENNVTIKFEAQTTLDNGVITCKTPVLPNGVTTTDLEGKAGVLVDTEGNKTILENTGTAVKEAILKGGTLYFTPNETIALSDNHIAVSEKGITVYGNGAKFGTNKADGTVAAERDFSVQNESGYYLYPEGAVVNINLYDLNNARVWGADKALTNYTVNVVMDNCTYVTTATSTRGAIMLRSGDTSQGVRNITVRNCYFQGGLPTIHSTHAGTLTVDNCTFKGAAMGINIAHKEVGTMDVKITNCTFDGCGCTSSMNSAYNYSAAVRVVQNERNSEDVTTSLSLYDCTFTNRVGNWDILLRDYRDSKVTFPVNIIRLDVDSSVKVANVDPAETSESEMFGN